ncbi:MAG: glycosyltransferase family 9 protein, partial [Acidobacteriota bacterium]
GDTGPLHLAHALDAPVLCLIGPTEPDRNGPYGAPDRVLFHRLPCSGCYQRLDSPRACLLSITPRQVTDRAFEMLESALSSSD